MSRRSSWLRSSCSVCFVKLFCLNYTSVRLQKYKKIKINITSFVFFLGSESFFACNIIRNASLSLQMQKRSFIARKRMIINAVEGEVGKLFATSGKESLLKFRSILGEFPSVCSCSRIGVQEKVGGTLGKKHRNFRISRQG